MLTETQKKIIQEDSETIARYELTWSKLDHKTILITGANGYVPQYIVHGIIKHNDLFGSEIKVLALCRNRKKAEMRFSEYINRKDFKLIIQDVKSPITIDCELHYIIHAASPAGANARYNDPVETFDANVIGCKNMLELAKTKSATFLLISSIDIYGKWLSADRMTENCFGGIDPLNIRNVYSCAKIASESLSLCYTYHNVKSKVVRPSQILAGGIQLNDGRLHIDFISQILNNHKIVLKGDGTPKRTFLYITDAITGILTVLLDGQVGQAYNLCSERGEATVFELASIMADTSSNEKIEISYNLETRTTDPAVTNVVSIVCGDSTKIRNLGWNAMVDLKTACRRMAKYYGID